MEKSYPQYGVKCPLCQIEGIKLKDVDPGETIRKYADSAMGSPGKPPEEEESIEELKGTLRQEREEDKEDLKKMSADMIRAMIPDRSPDRFMGYTDFGSVPRRMKMTQLSRRSNYIFERM